MIALDRTRLTDLLTCAEIPPYGGALFYALKELWVKVKQPVSPLEASQIISDFGVWKLDRPDIGDILEAIRISQRYMISFRDSLAITSAINLNCDVIWSEDLNLNQYFNKVKVINPFL